MHPLFRFAAASALLVLAAACGGGGTHNALPVTAVATAVPTGKTSLLITVDRGSAASSAARRPRYISSAAQSLVYTIAFGGVPVPLLSGNDFSNFTSPYTACTGPGAGAPVTCSANLNVDFTLHGGGSYTIDVATYDAPQTADCSPSAGTCAGNLLSRTTVLATIAIGQANVVSLTLAGLPASSAIVPLAGAPVSVFAGVTQVLGSAKFAVLSYDAANALIVGPGSPSYTIAATGPATVTQPTAAAPNVFTVATATGGVADITETAALSAGPNVVCGSGGVVCTASLHVQAFVASSVTLSGVVAPIGVSGSSAITASDPSATALTVYSISVSGGCSLASGQAISAQTITGSTASFTLYTPASAATCVLAVTDSALNSAYATVPVLVQSASLASIAASAPDASGIYFRSFHPYTLTINLDSVPNLPANVALSSTGPCAVPPSVNVNGSSVATVALTAPGVSLDSPCTIMAALGGATKSATFTVAANAFVQSLSTPFSVPVGTSIGLTAALNAPTHFPLGLTVQAAGDCSLSGSSTLTIGVGGSSAAFTVIAGAVSGQCSVTVTDENGAHVGGNIMVM
jgi:hypothetical protein